MPAALKQKSILPVLVVIAIGAIIPLLLSSGFHLRLAMLIWIYAILCMGFNLLYGFTGQISLGQQAFFSVSAYAFTLLQMHWGWPPVVAFVASIVICALLALVIGLPLLRLRTHYLAMATLAFGLILNGVSLRWIDFTGGTSGLAVKPLVFFGDTLGREAIYYLVLFFAAVVLLLHDFIIRSHIGRALQAIRDDDTAASALGVHVTRYKLRMFVLAAAIAAVAGICFSVASLRVDPSMSDFHIIVSILTVVVVGGLGTRFGPIIGAAFVVILPQVLISFGELETLVYGALILIFLLFLPHGLAGLIESAAWRKVFRRPSPVKAEAHG